MARQFARGIDHVAAVIQGLRSRVQLQAEYAREIARHVEHVTRFVRAHGHMVFGIGAGRYGIHRGRMRARAQVVDDGGSRVLHDHETAFGAVLVADQERRQTVVRRRIDQLVQAPLRDRGQHRNGGLQVAHRQRQRHAVEMAGRHHLVFETVRAAGFRQVREQQRIVGDGVELDVEHALGLLQRIAHGAVHLRDATQGITVLRLVLLAAAERLEAQVELLATVALRQRHPVPANVEGQRLLFRRFPAFRLPGAETRHQVVIDVGQGRTRQQGAQVRRGLHLARMRTQFVHMRIESAQATGEGIDRHRRGKIGRFQQLLQLGDGEHAGGQHLRRAVVQGQAFLVR